MDISLCCCVCVFLCMYRVCLCRVGGVMENSHDVFLASLLLLLCNLQLPLSPYFFSSSFSLCLSLSLSQYSHVREPAGIFQDAG